MYFNKAGKAFGFHVENAFIAYGRGAGVIGDQPKDKGLSKGQFKRALFITVGVYVNADGILNNNKYEYKKISVPLFDGIGRAVAEYLLSRGSFSSKKINNLHE